MGAIFSWVSGICLEANLPGSWYTIRQARETPQAIRMRPPSYPHGSIVRLHKVGVRPNAATHRREWHIAPMRQLAHGIPDARERRQDKRCGDRSQLVARETTGKVKASPWKKSPR